MNGPLAMIVPCGLRTPHGEHAHGVQGLWSCLGVPKEEEEVEAP